MKIVAFIGNPSPPLIYFVNKLHETHGLVAVIIDKNETTSHKKPTNSKTYKPFSIEKLCRHYIFRKDLKRLIQKRAQELQDYHAFCGSLYSAKSTQLNSSLKVLEFDNINSVECHEALRQLQADLLVDHGTRLLKPTIIESAPLALNLHWGLSPYYRGVDCTRHALFNWDVNNIGVTIHKLSAKIDGGDILGQQRVEINEDDTVARITAKLTFEGTEIVSKAISKLKVGEVLEFHEQEFTEGFLFKHTHWTPEFEDFFTTFDPLRMKRILANPSRDKVNIHEIH